MTQLVELIFNAVANPFWLRLRDPVNVVPAKVSVSVLIAIVSVEALIFTIVKTVPSAYATLALAGMVKVKLVPFITTL
jgi:hypothetical protein